MFDRKNSSWRFHLAFLLSLVPQLLIACLTSAVLCQERNGSVHAEIIPGDCCAPGQQLGQGRAQSTLADDGCGPCSDLALLNDDLQQPQGELQLPGAQVTIERPTWSSLHDAGKPRGVSEFTQHLSLFTKTRLTVQRRC